MSLALLVAAALFIGVMAYAVFGGADFGPGFLDLTAGGPTSGAELRTLVDHSIGPVWEANHVWLIYVLVTWWTAFPQSFASAMSTLIMPMLLALLGIVLRGAAFAFRKYSETLAQARLFGVVCAGSSLITQFFLGCVAGAIASGRVPAEGRGDVWASWLTTTSIVGGVVAVGTCAFLAGCFLVADASRSGATVLAEQLRTRTLAVGVATGAVVAGSGIGQYPWLLVDEVTIEQAAGAPATLGALLVAVGLAGVIVLPALAYLYWLNPSEAWSRH